MLLNNIQSLSIVGLHYNPMGSFSNPMLNDGRETSVCSYMSGHDTLKSQTQPKNCTYMRLLSSRFINYLSTRLFLLTDRSTKEDILCSLLILQELIEYLL